MKKGFTLLEILLVVAVLGVLVTIFFVANSGHIEKAEKTKNEANKKTIEQALFQYQLEKDGLPTGKSISYGDISSETKQTIESLLEKEDTTNTSEEVRNVLSFAKTLNLSSYLKTKTSDYFIIDDSSPYLAGYVFSIRSLSGVQVIPPNGLFQDESGSIHAKYRLFPQWLVTFAIKEDGTVWGWGDNSLGAIGDGTFEIRTTPVPVKGIDGKGVLRDIKMISSGGNHTIALTNSGDVLTWGYNRYGQVSDKVLTNSPYPLLVKKQDGTFLQDIIQVSGGDYHNLALTKDGHVYAWGFNSRGQLGLGNNTDVIYPTLVKNKDNTGPLENVTSIYASILFSEAIMNDGKVMTWGSNDFGKLGDGTLTDRNLPGFVFGLDHVQSLGVGAHQTIAVLTDGTLFGWGDNKYGQLGDGTNTPSSMPKQIKQQNGEPLANITSIYSGFEHIFVKDKNNMLYEWGRNDLGQLGDGTWENSLFPKLFIDPKTGKPITNYQEISIGRHFGYLQRKNGTVVTWGRNEKGQLGIGNTTNQNTFQPFELK